MSNKETEDSSNHKLNIATVGSKNRVCLPPKLVAHQHIEPKDHVLWILKTDKKGKTYSIMHVVKPENFEVEDDEIETIEDTFKKDRI